MDARSSTARPLSITSIASAHKSKYKQLPPALKCKSQYCYNNNNKKKKICKFYCRECHVVNSLYKLLPAWYTISISRCARLCQRCITTQSSERLNFALPARRNLIKLHFQAGLSVLFKSNVDELRIIRPSLQKPPRAREEVMCKRLSGA